MKRIILLILVVTYIFASVLILFAGGRKEETKKLRIAYIGPTNEPYYKFGFDGTKLMAEEMGVDIMGYISDMKPDREIASIEDAITQQVDGIVLFSVSLSVLKSGIEKAYNAGIPIIKYRNVS